MSAAIIEDIWVLGRFLRWIYKFIRKNTNYRKILLEAEPLTQEIVRSILPLATTNKYFSKSAYACLVYHENDDSIADWDMLLISNKYRYLTEISLSANNYESLKLLDKRLIYSTSIQSDNDANDSKER